VDLPEILLEIAARTDFTAKFTHISERDSRAGDLAVSICAVLIAEACNIGMEPLVRNDVPALRRSRLSWVSQNFVRNETITEANASLVAAQNNIYINAALEQLAREGHHVTPEDVARLSPLVFEHINLLGRYAFSVPEAVTRGELRPLRNPAEVLEEVA
jgi:hypothetical protein